MVIKYLRIRGSTMSLSIMKLKTVKTDARYDTMAFRRVIEDHLPHLLQPSNMQVFTVSVTDSNKFRGDAYGLFKLLKIPDYLFNITLRLNGLRNSAAWDGELLNVFIAKPKVIETILTRHLANKP